MGGSLYIVNTDTIEEEFLLSLASTMDEYEAVQKFLGYTDPIDRLTYQDLYYKFLNYLGNSIVITRDIAGTDNDQFIAISREKMGWL